MNIKIQRLAPDAVIPYYTSEGDAAMDLTAMSKEIIDNKDYGYIQYGTGIAIEIPIGHCALIFPRSSISNTGMILANSVGVIDSNYRGEIKVRFKYIRDTEIYKIGDRIAQLMIVPIPSIEFEEVGELSKTIRNEQGFGSSGK